MKIKILFLSVIVTLVVANQHAKGQVVNQGMDDNIGLAVNKGDVLISGFLSYPNWGRYLANVQVNSSSFENGRTGGFAPLGGQIEFMLSDIFGFSFDAIFNQWSASWTSSGFNNAGDVVQYENKVSVTRTRLLIGLNYHLDDLKNDQLNLYGGFAVGFNDRRLNVNLEDQNTSEFWDGPLAFPLAARARIGMRYFVSDAIGLNLELGAGGPILRGGLTFKLSTVQ
jgi:hypothetical protein